MRSFLFVPADSERKLAKGPTSGPDGLILDLEDSVAADRKPIARDMALAYLKSANRTGPKLYVRVNALDTGLTLGDLAIVMQGKPDGIVFPKCVGQANLDLLANYPDIKNVEGLRAEARDARRMGYGGKIAIHPDQVAIIHEVFTPSAQEIDWAKRVVATFRDNPSSGVLTLDGKMLDRPHLVLAERLLARAGE